MYDVEILADSIDNRGNRLITVKQTYPRVIHSENMTHRVFSRNAASTRAIPLLTQIRNLLDNPFIPERFGVNQPGMQSFSHLDGLKHDEAVAVWLAGRDRALTTTLELILGRAVMEELFRYDPLVAYVTDEELRMRLSELAELVPKSTAAIDLSETSMLNVHKQLAGRGLESYMWMTVIVTATEWDNYFALRDHEDAQGEIATIARMTRVAVEDSIPNELQPGEWHLPLVTEAERAEYPVDTCIKMSGARCAAVSYRRELSRNAERELQRYTDLVQGGHMSPLEHQATPFDLNEWAIRDSLVKQAERMARVAFMTEHDRHILVEKLMFKGPLRGWTSHRKTLAGEDNFARLLQKGAS